MATMIGTYDEWMTQVRAALESINMSVDEWQTIWPFDFRSEYQKGAASADVAARANRFWWYQQNRSLKQECQKTANCWLPDAHQGACQPLS